MKLKDAINEFIAWKNFTAKKDAKLGFITDLRQLCLFLHNPELEVVRWEHILQLTNEMTDIGWDESSYVRKFNSYRKFFEYWHSKNPLIMDHTWIPVKKAEYKRPRVMTEEYYNKLIKAVESHQLARGVDPSCLRARNLCLLNMLWDTGARVGEIVSLNVSELDLNKRTSIIKTEKSRGKRPLRDIFWTEETNDNLKRWLEFRKKISDQKGYFDPDALLPVLTGRNIGRRLRIGGVCQVLGVMCDRAKIPRMNAHSFRHHMGHDIIAKGGSNSDVSNILGHSSLDSSFVYTMTNNEELRERYNKFKAK